MPRNILFVIDAMARGGTELQLRGLIGRLDRSRWTPHLCTLRPSPPELAPDDCPHLAWDVPRLLAPGGLAAAWRLSRLLRRGRFAAVLTYFQDATVFGAVAARLAGVPVRLASFRDMGFWRTPRQVALMRRAYPLLTGFVANARVVKDEFVRLDGLDPARVTVVPNGIATEDVVWQDHTGPVTDVGIVGNLNRRVKRTDLFIRAAAQVAADHPHITWHVLGDGQFRAEYEALARASGLAERLIFAGRVPDVAAHLARWQIGVISSDSEGLSNALLEYMLAGCVPVATAVGGNPEAVTDGKTGLLVPPDDADALAAAIASLVADPARRRELAQAARRDAETRFGWEACVAAHEKLFAPDGR